MVVKSFIIIGLKVVLICNFYTIFHLFIIIFQINFQQFKKRKDKKGQSQQKRSGGALDAKTHIS